MQVLIPAGKIQDRLRVLASEISGHYQGESVTIVGVLTGCLMFLADLVRHLDLPIRIGFIQASSYEGTASGKLRIGSEILSDINGHHVLLLDDILDSGQTLRHLVDHLHRSGASSVRVGVLLRKTGKQKYDVAADYVGFEIPDAFVVGYGLDYNDHYRHLPYVAILPEDKIVNG